jgi:ribulose-bisphosphate carboxylase large chain
MVDQIRLNLLSKVARLYYEDGLTQNDIAKMLKTSHSTISRMLNEAIEKKIVDLSFPVDEIIEKAKYAKQAGVGGMLLIPSLIGWDTMRMLADNDSIALPIMSHPSFHSIYYQCKTMGFSAASLYGQIPRLAGADATIFPNFIGRFPSTVDDCLGVINSATKIMGKIKTSFPTPGGGLTLDKLPEYRNLYDNDVIYLMGGGLHFGNSLTENCRKFRKLVSQ